MLEPEEGRYDLGWLRERMDRMERERIRVVLATPSGAPPRWLTKRYPEVLRTAPDRRRNPPGRRLNFCPSSPRYRELVAGIVSKLAKEFGSHPALALWHVNNELAWPCHCESCHERFREWMRVRYGSLAALNRAWGTAFWSSRYSAWDEIESPPILDGMEHQRHEDIAMPGLRLDWLRFTSWSNADFLRHEIACIRSAGSEAPVTTNTWGLFGDFDPRDLEPLLDVISVDSYPPYKDLPGDERVSSQYAFTYDAARSFKRGQPFLLVETSPGMTYGPVGAKLKRPGQHRLSCLQAVAHGSDSVYYFQWRQSVSGAEQFHPAVVPHAGKGESRTFRDVAALGGQLSKLGAVVGGGVPAEAAVVFDRDVHWSMLSVHGFHSTDMNYPATCIAHYDALRELSVPMDVIHMDASLDGYKLVVAPMLFLVRPGVAERFRNFVENGGCLVGTYLSGYVDFFNSCFREGLPGPLRELFGVEVEDLDVLVHGPIGSTGWLAQLPVPPRPMVPNTIRMNEGNALGLSGAYTASPFCELFRCESAEPQASYAGEFYAGRPSVTMNRIGRGEVVYIGSRNEAKFLSDLYGSLVNRWNVRRTWTEALPPTVRVNERVAPDGRFLFFQNFGSDGVEVNLGGRDLVDAETGARCGGSVALPGFGVAILKQAKEG
jgi:beta-galactosidase